VTGGIEVETGYLKGYEKQIRANAMDILPELSSYCRKHCRNTEGMEGTLTPAKWPVERMADDIADLAAKAKNGLEGVAGDLRSTAFFYDRTEYNNAERMFEIEVPGDYREKNDKWSPGTDATFSSGPPLALAPPTDYKETKEARAQVFELVGGINDLIARFTGYNILENVLPVVFGEWGALRRVAEAWGRLENAFRSVGADLDEGASKLSSHWNSSVDGRSGASRQFDYHMRAEWVPAFRAIGQRCDLYQQVCEFMAKFYEDAVRDLLFLLNFYVRRIKKIVGKIWEALTDLKKTLGLLSFLIYTLRQAVEDIIDMIVVEYEKYREFVQMVASANVAVFSRGALRVL
jgi:hypothetical protein